ncbi:MAG: CBS domain-containing protein [Candidatus Thioglobus sp.]|jgi:CBS domain-containing protein|uniref:CBS domain-containing protein n=1 Tax=Candidatus Thioglobus sp. TaxID=2026721 RepID=UPI0030A0B46C
MIVQDIMTTDLKTVTADQPVKDIALMMIMDHISGAPVVDAENNLIGIISEKDILQHMFPKLEDIMSDTHFDFENMETNYKDTMNVKIGEIMTVDVDSIDLDIPCLKAASIMWLKQYRRIPVTQNGKLVGIISIGDVHRAIFKSCMTS